jgi:hypothetical protein
LECHDQHRASHNSVARASANINSGAHDDGKAHRFSDIYHAPHFDAYASGPTNRNP